MLVDLENVIIIIICIYYIFSYLFQPNWKEYSNMFIDYITGHRISEIETKIDHINNFIDELKNNVDIEKVNENPIIPMISEQVKCDNVSEVSDDSEVSAVSEVS